MKVSDLGEFGLIRRLASAIDGGPEELIVGVGDDAAVWRLGDRAVIATTDTLVEGVHFLAGAPWRDIGWKSLAVNVSDIAAMGGRPLFALVTLALPPQTDVAAIDDLYAGLNDCARRYGVTIAGGDIVRAPQVSVTVALLGEAQQRDGAPLLLRRDAARAGDVIAVTGTLGDAAAGLRRLREGATPGDPLARGHLHPEPPLAVGQRVAAAGVCCGIDVSDGLLQDVGHICDMSHAGAVIRAPDVPLSEQLLTAYPGDALALACTGGEDYQAVLAGPRAIIERLQPVRRHPSHDHRRDHADAGPPRRCCVWQGLPPAWPAEPVALAMTSAVHFESRSPDDTRVLGERLGRCLQPGDVVLLSGELGAGKTVFVQGIARGAGYEGAVSSKSFVLLGEYPGRVKLYHADLYRLEAPEQVEELALDEVCADGALVVEWPERAGDVLPEQHLARPL